MIVIIDTSVLLSAFLSSGLGAEVLGLVQRRYTHAVSPELLNEYEQKLRTKFKVPAAEAREMTMQVAMNALFLEPPPSSKPVSRGPKDDFLVALADLSQADYLISYDKDLLNLKRRGRTKIVKPSEFWVKFRDRDR